MTGRIWTAPLAIVGAWSVVGALDVAKAFTIATIRGEHPPLGYLLAGHLPTWYGWAILTPLVLFMCGRFPLRGGRGLSQAVLAHAIASVAIGSAHLTASAVLFRHVMLNYRPESFDPTTGLTQMVGLWFDALFVVEVLVYWAIVFAVTGWRYYDRARQEELVAERLRTEAARSQLVAANARLQALRRELEPHFLFNTLNAVAGMIRTARRSDAVDVLVALSDLLRQTVTRNQPHEVTLRDEIALLTKYLEIQRIRFADRLTVVVHIDDKVADALVPRFILQPLVENAVRHGLEHHAGPGTIEVHARRIAAITELQVRNSSVPGARIAAVRPTGGVGLANTRARLEQLYGTQGRFELQDAQEGQTTAIVQIPYHRQYFRPPP